MSKDNENFHLGITMAGAVSAGCYTAGVMDYIFEALELWEQAKQGNIEGLDPELIPPHKVTIDVMGGASAGGMTTVISALYALQGKIKSVKTIPTDPLSNQNLLFDSWVHLDDRKSKTTFSKLWDTDDLDEGLISLFNSKPIDAIADNLLDKFVDENTNLEKQLRVLPAYISDDLELLLSHTLLRGIPLSVDFKTEVARRTKNSPRHSTYEHYFVSHFKLNKGHSVDEKQHLWFNPYKQHYSNILKLSTVATGAFPVGLAYRTFDSSHFNDDYVKATIKRVIYGDYGVQNPDTLGEIEFENSIKDFESVTVDGGAINNEPYREVESILRQKFRQEDNLYQNYGLIMIDPFPDVDTSEEYKTPEGLLQVVPKIIQTLWNQSKVKRKEMYEQYSSDFFKGVIYPRKHITKNNIYQKIDKHPLLSAAFGAFGGFLSIDFRVHDFFLGRNNARNFIQYFGSLPYDPENNNVHPIHRNWTLAMISKYQITKEENGIKQVFLPVIPDINLVLEDKSPGEDRFTYTYADKPKFQPKFLFDLKPKITKRLKSIINNLDSNSPTKVNANFPITNNWMNKNYSTNWLRRTLVSVGGWGTSVAKKVAINVVSKRATKAITETILKDLEKMKALEESK